MRSVFVSLVVLACVALVLVDANTCGGNCPSNDCSGCPCGTTTAYQNIASWCSRFSGWNQAQCQCIMSHESGGNANAANQNKGGSYDIGLWQVNSMNWNACSGGHPPCDGNTNLQCAIDVWRWGGNTFKLWSTCGGCGACSVRAGEEMSLTWDGQWPEGYDPSRPFPPHAINGTDPRFAENLHAKNPSAWNKAAQE